jgi:hypothetical protein
MTARVINAVLCDRININGCANLEGAGSKWPSPPARICLWVEIENLPKAEFQVAAQVRRGARLIDETYTELVLAGKPYWQMGFEWEDLEGFQPKTYTFTVLVNGLPARTMIADFGAKGPA